MSDTRPEGPAKTKGGEGAAPDAAYRAPTIQPPKGGGAIRGIGEKFAANPVNGSGSVSVPVATSPSRGGFGPQLALSYDSGVGNGPFGFGWTLGLPAITRRTDQGLPRYHDPDASDVFVFSGGEDLVPVLEEQAPGVWEAPALSARAVAGTLYRIDRYRPRIEGAFARIERWSGTAAGDVFWRTISRDNVTSWYGRSTDSRIADPADPARVFSWLICESYDDRGNAIVYGYKAEDSARIFEDAAGIDQPKVHERNRTEAGRSAQRYIKRIRYGNRTPFFPTLAAALPWPQPAGAAAADASDDWLFELVFDYGDHDAATPTQAASGVWPARPDPFSSHRAGFEVRTYRTCRRVLMFHHFPNAPDVGRGCLVRSTDLTHSDVVDPTNTRNPIYSFLRAVTQTGWRREGAGYRRASVPPVEFTYTTAEVQDTVHDIDAGSMENAPVGLDDAAYRWTDLHGEGLSGLLSQQGEAWFYKRNLSPLPPDDGGPATARLAPLETVSPRPHADLRKGAQILDLAGDGLPDVVLLRDETQGFYEHDDAEGWTGFRPFAASLRRNTGDADLRLVDLTGDGLADVLVSEGDGFSWHESLGEAGFGLAHHVQQPLDDERGPRLVFADPTGIIYLADMSGDGLTDLVRIRNGEVAYWSNLGYGRFGAKVTMDGSPWFDNPDGFDNRRIRVADIDGSGTSDILYLHRDGVRLYFNQSGNSWSQPRTLAAFPRVDDLASIVPVDLLGNGTACLVWSSPLPAATGRQMRYVDLMGGIKPHLLTGISNNLGAETRIDYAPSTRFYLQDRRDGRKWLSRLPFPVQVVARTTTYDHVSRNRFSSRYAYHHGYFDGQEREFRGFGMVEQWDSERIGAIGGPLPAAENLSDASDLPPVHIKTWFHTGMYLGRDRVSRYFAGLSGGRGEYYREPGLTDAEAEALLLADSILPPGLSVDEEREACRALKGSMLRQEVYADDAGPGSSDAQIRRAATPYTVTEQNFALRQLQPRGPNPAAVFLTHALETISYHYEREPSDPRIQHSLTLEVDEVGHIRKQAAAAYGRRPQLRRIDGAGNVQLVPNPGLAALDPEDRAQQTVMLLTYSENRFTDAVAGDDVHRLPLICEAKTFALTGYAPTGPAGRLLPGDLVEPDGAGGLRHRFAAPEVAYETIATGSQRRRPIEVTRTLYRRDDLAGLLPLGTLQARALPGEAYRMSFTPGLIARIFRRPRSGQLDEDLLPSPATVLSGQGGDGGGYVGSQTLKAAGLFPASDPDDHWWSPSGRVLYSANPADSPATELAIAQQHFFLGRRYRDPFGQDTHVGFDSDDLLLVEARDALDNRILVEANDYRVLQARLVSDVNRNRTEVAFDTLGLVVATAVMGKAAPAPVEGDRLTGLVPDLTDAERDTFLDAADPRPLVPGLIGDATTRLVHDLDRFRRTRAANPGNPDLWQPACIATLARETHASAPLPPGGARFQAGFTYSDGFNREIQRKAQAEPGPLAEGDPALATRWVGSGWTILDNKGQPVRQYEPFFSATHRFEFAVLAGVSAILFYDPAGRAVATLAPDHSYHKLVVTPWQQTSYDANDCSAPLNAETGDPRTDPDIAGHVAAYFAAEPPGWQTWYAQRITGALGPDEQKAAERAAAHADTPTTLVLDVLARPFLTLSRNRITAAGHPLDGTEATIASRVENDIEGNLRAVRDGVPQAGDAHGRVVARHDYDMLGNRCRLISMEAGERWTLADVLGQTIRAWDSRGHDFTFRHDALRRVTDQTVTGTSPDSDPRALGGPLLVDRLEYGEGVPNAEALNLRLALWRHHDSAGIVTYARLDANGQPTAAYDFKRNLLASRRQLVSDYRAIPDWSQAPALDAEYFESSALYDALNRPIQSVEPHSSLDRPQNAPKLSVVQLGFNEANLLERIDVWLERATAPTALLDPTLDPPSPVGLANIDYDAKAQRQSIDYRNGARSRFRHDPLTLRLTDIVTEREAADWPGDDPAPPPSGWPGRHVQNLHYVYDAAGNVSHIADSAQQAVFFRNRRVEPGNDYVHDALYRLIAATGREHLGQVGGTPVAWSSDDAPRVRLLAPGDGNAMASYVERYVHDPVGNLLEMRHIGSDPASPVWRRTFDHAESSLIEDGTGGTLLKTGNRLTRSTLGAGGPSPVVETYTYDAHGNMTRMPHLGGSGDNIVWDYRDQLVAVDLGAGGSAHYIYDGAGQRLRKVREKNGGGRVEERISLGGFEIYREHAGAIATGNVTLERETLHVIEGTQRIALVETRTRNPAGDDRAPRIAIRYQHGNHLGSVALELDERAQVVSYEEYSPFGSTTYSAARSLTETPKRFRFTGVERDEETGFGYHGARYYIPWLGRWTRCDPIGIEGGLSLYVYVGSAPVRLVDPDGNEPKLHSNFDNGWTYKSMPGLTFYQSDEGYVFTDDGQNLQALDNKHFSIIETSGVPVMNHLDNTAYEIPAQLLADSPGEVSSAGTRWHANGPRQFYRNPVAMQRAMRGYRETGRLDYTNNADIWEAGHGCAACHVEHLTNGAPTNSQLDLDRYNKVALLTKVGRDLVSLGTGGYDPTDPFVMLRMGLRTASPQNRPPVEEPPTSGGSSGKSPGKSPAPREPEAMAPTFGTRKADPATTIAAENVTPKAGRFDIAVHADQKSFWVRTGPGKNDWAKIPTTRVAEFMRSKGYTGGPVRLIACESGALANGPAQKLANELGTGVLAPTGKVWIHPDGRLTIGATPKVSTGRWVWFGPKK